MLQGTRFRIAIILMGLVLANIGFAAPPVAERDTVVTPPNESVRIPVLENDVFDDLQLLDIKIIRNPEHGTAVLDGSVVVYTPDPDYTGADFFQYGIRNIEILEERDQASVIIEVRPHDAGDSANLGGNQQQVFNAIEQFCLDLFEQFQQSGEDLPLEQRQLAQRCVALRNADEEDQTRALRQISGEKWIAATDTTLKQARNLKNNLSHRLSTLRSGINTRVDTNGFQFVLNDVTVPAKALTSLFEVSMGSNAQSDQAPANISSYSPWSFFINGSIGEIENDETELESGYSSDSNAVTLGGDYRLNSNFILGLAFASFSEETKFDNDGGELETDNRSLTLYSTYYRDNFYMDAVVGFGQLDYTGARNIQYTLSSDSSDSVDTTTSSNTEGSQTQLGFTGHYDFNRNAWTFSPYLSLNLVRTSIDSFTEDNGGGWEIQYDEQDIDSLTLALGARASHVYSASRFVMVNQLRIASLSELEDGESEIGAQFVNGGASATMTFTSEDPDTQYMEVAWSTSFVFTGGLSAFFDYETIQSLENRSESVLTLGARWEAAF